MHVQPERNLIPLGLSHFSWIGLNRGEQKQNDVIRIQQDDGGDPVFTVHCSLPPPPLTASQYFNL